jgi:hypothetical protein
LYELLSSPLERFLDYIRWPVPGDPYLSPITRMTNGMNTNTSAPITIITHDGCEHDMSSRTLG